MSPWNKRKQSLHRFYNHQGENLPSILSQNVKSNMSLVENIAFIYTIISITKKIIALNLSEEPKSLRLESCLLCLFQFDLGLKAVVNSRSP